MLVARQAACTGLLARAKQLLLRDDCPVPNYKTNHVIVLDVAAPASGAGAGAGAGAGGAADDEWPSVRAIRHLTSWGKNARVVGGSHPNWMADGDEVRT